MTTSPGSDRGSASGLLVRRTGGHFTTPAVIGYANEAELQQILFEHPTLLPGVEDPAVACREFQSGAGPADVIVVHGTGQLVVTECKLASNPQIRREVVGQVIDYASRLWGMSVAEFESRWAIRTSASPFDSLGETAAAREALAANLQAGRFTLVLAVDGINDDLRRMVEYLNAVTVTDTQVLAFEVARAVDGDVEILLPRVYGAELASSKNRRGVTTSQPSWNQDDYFTWLHENAPSLEPVMRHIVTAATGAGWVVANGTAASPSLILACDVNGARCWPVSLFTVPSCSVHVRVYQVADRDPAPSVRLNRLIERLAAIPGANVDAAAIRAAGYRKRVDLSAEILIDEQASTALLQALAEIPDPG